jgi:gas vesicle protein
MSKNRSGRFFSGVLLGAAAGAIAGLLAAPRPGQETRSQLKKTAQQSADTLPELAEDLKFKLQVQADRLSESAHQGWNDTLLRLRDAIAAGVEAGMEAGQRTNQRTNQRSTNPSDRPKETGTKLSAYSVDDE